MSSDSDWSADPAFVVDFRQNMRQMGSVPPVWHGGVARRNYVPQQLPTAAYVFVRVGAHRGPLQSPSQGPFKVIDWQGKFYKLDLGTRHDMVSIHRLKPAFLEEATHAIEPRRPSRAAEQRSPTRPTHTGGAKGEVVSVVTSSGRLVRLPIRFGSE